MFNLTAHRWVREGGDASEIPIDISVLSNMRQFVKYSRFKQFALRVCICLLLFTFIVKWLFLDSKEVVSMCSWARHWQVH